MHMYKLEGLFWAMNVWPYCGGAAVVQCKSAVRAHQMLLKVGKGSLKQSSLSM